MLETLHIQNYALIDDLELDFHEGFNVLTGETGAGKSIIVGALNLVLGARASADAVRKGTKRAKIDALFRVPHPSERLEEILTILEIEVSEDSLLLSRVVTAEGRSRAYVEGNLLPISILAQIGDELVDLHGQHEHQSLLKLERQRELLDSFADTGGLARDLREKVKGLRDLEKTIKELEGDDRETARRQDFLRHEAREIEEAQLGAGEEEEVRARHNLITNAEKVATLASDVHASLYEGSEAPVIDSLDLAVRNVQELAEIDKRFQPLVEGLESVRADVESIDDEIRQFTDSLEFDSQELEALNARLALIGNLKRKYGATIEEILAYGRKASEEIDAFNSRDERLETLRRERDDLRGDAMKEAERLSKKRRGAGRVFAQKISRALGELGMEGAVFDVSIDSGDLEASGVDRIEFMLSANPGEPQKALRHVASGGEISRVMLALKSELAQGDGIDTLVFDEIDAGVGGAVANRVADKLKGLTRTHQTISITHLPQIAAAADAHFTVSKERRHGRTLTSIGEVRGTARIEEIARLLDGASTDVSMEHARELLKVGNA